jgi:hypothetical protein
VTPRGNGWMQVQVIESRLTAWFRVNDKSTDKASV